MSPKQVTLLLPFKSLQGTGGGLYVDADVAAITQAAEDANLDSTSLLESVWELAGESGSCRVMLQPERPTTLPLSLTGTDNPLE